ncbi:FAD-binding protein [Rhizobium sp. Root708]|uniref:NAD(P)-binding protein n=1 Tax=Rhizobium sp. Root708 TaxID=1736592 RepID=UPI0006FF0BD6|nr:NAD(P)-binding protein [Rhizobium sp. Root708]KRB49289.1 FAD-binding protein [Rhizobium sp. Root708]
MDEASTEVTNSPSDDYYDVVVLGAGISGLVAASILSSQGNRVLVADDYKQVGGNHMDWTSTEGYTFDVGSLIFQDDSPLLRHFPELLAYYVPISPSWGRLSPQGKVTTCPISIRDDVLGAGFIGMTKILISLAFARLFRRELKNARDFARFWIGAELLRQSGLEAYMGRFYGLPAEEIDLELARKRMLWISEHASVTNLIRRALRGKQTGRPSNRQMARPKSGFSILYNAAAQKLKGAGVAFLTAAGTRQIRKTAAGFELEFSSTRATAARVVSTIPISVIEGLSGMTTQTDLRTITLITLYFSFDGERGFSPSIIYNFSLTGSWKRLTVYSDFYGSVAGREYFAVEVVGGGAYSSAEAELEFRGHVSESGIFKGDLKLEGSQILENAYPIYSRGATERAAEAVRRLEAYGIETIGRQGKFSYQPTARVSTIEVEAALGRRG